MPVRALRGSRTIGAEGTPRTLSALARTLGGADAVWLAWVRHRDSLLRIVVSDQGVDISRVAYPSGLLTDLAEATLLERDESVSETPRAALYRIATGPILADAALAARLKGTLLHGEARLPCGRPEARSPATRRDLPGT